MTTPSEEVRKAGRAAKKAKWIGLAAAVLTAATPGMYGAWEAAKAAAIARTETRVRDRQEVDLQKNVKALETKVDALAKASVTHRDLVDLVLRLRASDRPATTPHRPRPPSEPTAPEKALDAKLEALKKKATAGEQAVAKAKAITKAAPALKPARKVRQQLSNDPLNGLDL